MLAIEVQYSLLYLEMEIAETPQEFVKTFTRGFVHDVNQRTGGKFDADDAEDDFLALVSTYAATCQGGALEEIPTFLAMASHRKNAMLYRAILNEGGGGEAARNALREKVTAGVVQTLSLLGLINEGGASAKKKRERSSGPTPSAKLTHQDVAEILRITRVGGEISLEGAACVGRWGLFDKMNPDAVRVCIGCPVRLGCLANDIANNRLLEGCVGGLSRQSRKQLRERISR